MSTHLSGHLREGSLRNSQEAVRQNVRNGTLFIGPTKTTHLPQAGITSAFTRTAAGDYHIARSAAAGGAETDRFIVDLSDAFFVSGNAADAQRGEQEVGARILSFEPVYRVLVVNATSMTPVFTTATFTDAAAKAMTNRPVTPTPLAAGDISFHASNMQRVTISVTTPLIITPAMDATFEMTVVLANTGNFQWHGVYVNYDLYF